MRFRIQVELGPQSKVMIFRPDEAHVPESRKTYFTEVSLGLLGNSPDSVVLESDELIRDGDRIGVDLSRLSNRIGQAVDLSQFTMPVDVFRKFLADQRNNSD